MNPENPENPAKPFHRIDKIGRIGRIWQVTLEQCDLHEHVSLSQFGNELIVVSKLLERFPLIWTH